jgi:hypothetical protein
MANKEERIYIRKISVCDDARTKKLDWKECRCCTRPNGHCEYHSKSKDTIPYSKAIKRIKKSFKSIQCWPDSFNDSIAEVALNALLEGVK